MKIKWSIEKNQNLKVLYDNPKKKKFRNKIDKLINQLDTEIVGISKEELKKIMSEEIKKEIQKTIDSEIINSLLIINENKI